MMKRGRGARNFSRGASRSSIFEFVCHRPVCTFDRHRLAGGRNNRSIEAERFGME